ncbi:SubName: Full=Uncharacterized protein {ECO:0000313/EMBL:CCA68546.1} [Serendipita indica DSM 11827]|uniref:DRBM domain-containing protein n=1 Tax=Serendipita indica (strain DSM 11827) TaxID=1109443 RepID=G4TB45_SERID|nr:SubName: Full=Uncharacterized protein {ECO:0000313/EMBL:CCA68546.1} [Serendipita indica DSM 11827]CCA68546.1 hypothetical protein PIIN_02409 [Serendipita indica DSM 11827]
MQLSSDRDSEDDLILRMERNPGRVPKLPDLPVSIALEVFTDKSLRPKGDDQRFRADNEVLSLLGQSACQTIFTSILYARDPPLAAEELIAARQTLCSRENIQTWINHYRNVLSSVRCLPGVDRSPDVLTRAFYAYLGAVYHAHGHHVLDQFLRQLLEPAPEPAPQLFIGHPIGAHYGELVPAPSATSGSRSYAGVNPISILNDAAVRRGVKLEYDVNSMGPMHNITWMATALINGEWKGQGSGTSKQAAKEEAARAALKTLDW